MKIVLTQDVAEQFAAALIHIVRADHAIQPEEGRAVQDVVSELVEGVTVDFADAMLLTVTPESFAASISGLGGSPHRGVSMSAPADIARAFSYAAERVAGADGSLSSGERHRVTRYVDALKVVS